MKIMITIATDGSCIGNPGPGAYGFVAETEQGLFPKAIPVAATTVGEMEVRALLEALLYYIANHMEHDTALIRSEEHTSELQSLMRISYAVFCLHKQTIKIHNPHLTINI